MKVNILYNTTNSPHGGGNQFLRALKKQLTKLGMYSDASNVDIFLFNSHHNLDMVMSLRTKYPDKKFVHRIDGPMRLYNNMSDARDYTVYQANSSIADGTVFQSRWSFNANQRLGFFTHKPTAVIHNSVDSSTFNPGVPTTISSPNKRRLISCSFSPNMKKGYETYRFLDESLDFEKFEYIFAGNSPVKFKNIVDVGCLDSVTLATALRKSDIFVTASESDPCSNSLLEAIACELKVLALNDGGHPEIVKDEACLFDSTDELLAMILDFDKLKNPAKMPTIEEVTSSYLGFFEEVMKNE